MKKLHEYLENISPELPEPDKDIRLTHKIAKSARACRGLVLAADLHLTLPPQV